LDTTYLYSPGGYNSFISKMDTAGMLLWAKSVEGITQQEPLAIAVDRLGNSVITGYYNDSADFDPGPGVHMLFSNGPSDVFLLKLDIDGNYMWANTMGSDSDFERGFSIDIDHTGNIYTTGFIDGTSYYDSIGNYNLFSNMFVSKTSPMGNLIWNKKLETVPPPFRSLYSFSYCVALNPLQEIFLAGAFSGTVDFDPGPGKHEATSNGWFPDIFILKLTECNLFFVTQPIDQSLMENTSTYFTAKASLPTATYQWQQDTGSGFANLGDTGVYYGTSDSLFGIAYIDLSLNNTSYRCIIHSGNCYDTSVVATLTVTPVPTGMAEWTTKSERRIYPNPSTGYFTIQSLHPGKKTTYTLYSIVGVAVATGELDETLTHVDIRSLPTGIYMLHIGDDVYKIIKGE
jgi:hypothetical protein